MPSPLERFAEFYNTFSRDWLDRLPEMYAPELVFEDPFHKIVGDLPAFRAYLGRALDALHETRFSVEDIATGRDGSYVRWRWSWRRKANHALKLVDGVTHLRFSDSGLITQHRDLFDAASGFYETLPALGRILRAIKKRI